MNPVEHALESMLDGYSHQVAYDRLLKNHSPSVALRAVQDAGEKLPFIRQQIESRAEEHTPSGCCDHCGAELTRGFTTGQTLRWQNRSTSGWSDGAIDGLAYLCKRCRGKLVPSALECATEGLRWAAPLVVVGGLIDFFWADQNAGVGLASSLFFAALVFAGIFSRHSQSGCYRGYPSDTGMGFRRASFRHASASIPQLGMVLLVFGFFGGGCSLAVSTELERHFQYAPVIVALVIGLSLFSRHKQNLAAAKDRDPSRSWFPRKERNKLDSNDPEFVARRCAQLITSGLNSYETRHQLRSAGSSKAAIDQALRKVAPRVAFSRTQRGEMKMGRLCDLCETSFPDKAPEKMTWTFSRKTYIPLYVVTITQEESETKTGYHLLCDACRSGIDGPGNSLWATASSLGLYIGLLSGPITQLFLSKDQSFWFTVVLTALLWLGGLVYGIPKRYSGYPANEQFYPEGRLSDAMGVLSWIVVLLLGFGSVFWVSFYDLAPWLEALGSLILIAGACLLFRVFAKLP
jgi:hypothetical protein